MSGEVEAEIAAVLTAHQFGFKRDKFCCTCGGWRPVIVADGRDSNGIHMHEQHLAHLAAVLAPVVRAASERAVEFATCDCGDWDGHPGDCAMWRALRRYEKRAQS